MCNSKEAKLAPFHPMYFCPHFLGSVLVELVFESSSRILHRGVYGVHNQKLFGPRFLKHIRHNPDKEGFGLSRHHMEWPGCGLWVE